MTTQICLFTAVGGLLVLVLAYLNAYVAQRKVNQVLIERIKKLEERLEKAGIPGEAASLTLPAGANVALRPTARESLGTPTLSLK